LSWKQKVDGDIDNIPLP